MLRLWFLVCVIGLFSGCATQTPQTLNSANADLLPVNIPLDSFDMIVSNLNIQTTIAEPNLPKQNLVFEDAPFKDRAFFCDLIPFEDEQAEIRELLRSAKTIITLKGTFERWIPIEGAPKTYYVLRVN
ncbi:hypothetical protein [Sessilibacter sp. MAH4]